MNILFCFFFSLLSLASEQQSADIFDMDGKEKKFTFSAERVYDKETMTYTATFKDNAGVVVANESATVTKGQLVKYEVERITTKEKGVIEVKEGKIHFSYTENGKTSTAKDNIKEDTLVSAMLVPFLTSRMNDLLAKKDVSFRYAVWFRKEVVGFKFSLESDEARKAVIKMVPSNLLYRSLVKPIYFTFEKSSKKLISIKGRTLPKINEGGSWRDFDGFSKYQ